MTPTDLRILLLRTGKSQAQIARELGLSRNSVNQVVLGQRSTPRIRRAIAEAVSLSYRGVWGADDPGIDRLPPGRPVIASPVNANREDAA